MSIVFEPIGVIHSPYDNSADTPKNGLKNMEATATIELYDRFAEGARDIEPGSWGVLVFHFNRTKDYELAAHSRKHDRLMGVFSTRTPHRPNHIGVSTVQFVRVEGNRIEYRGVDVLDGTPLLDIKPCDSETYPGRV